MLKEETKTAIIAWLITNKIKHLVDFPVVGELILEYIQHHPTRFYDWVTIKMAGWEDDICKTFQLHIAQDQLDQIAKEVTEFFRREIVPSEPEFKLILAKVPAD